MGTLQGSSSWLSWGLYSPDKNSDEALGDSLNADEMRSIYRESARTQRWDAYIYGNGAQEFRDRVFATIEKIASDHLGDRVVVACHGGVIGTYISRLWGADIDNVCHVHHTSITTVRAMDEFRRVIAVNDYAHVLPFQNAINELNAN